MRGVLGLLLRRANQPWDREHVVVDTAGQEPQESLASLVRRLHAYG
ncbi:hypothetical protein [Streptomyces sp. SID2119]|nr:hypothetical protein [Streptomyces sp. SID2119]